MYDKIAILRLTPVVYYISWNQKMFLWFNFWNILNRCILNTNTWITIIKFGGHHASKFGIIYSNGRPFGFNYTHTSLNAQDLLQSLRKDSNATLSFVYIIFVLCKWWISCDLIIAVNQSNDSIHVLVVGIFARNSQTRQLILQKFQLGYEIPTRVL